MEPKDTERLLVGGDPLRDAEAVATRLLAIDEAERVREVLRAGGIACQLRLIKPDEVRGPRSDPLLLSVGEPLGDGPSEERQVAVLVLPADREAAARWIGPLESAGPS
jgi:hypothetical protein